LDPSISIIILTITGFRAKKGGPKSGQEKLANLDALNLTQARVDGAEYKLNPLSELFWQIHKGFLANTFCKFQSTIFENIGV
jgi:hypothetical protein